MKTYPYPLDKGDLSVLSEEDKMKIIHEIASSEAKYFNVILEDDAYGNPHLYGVYSYANQEELEEIRRSVWYSWAEPRSHWEALLDIRSVEPCHDAANGYYLRFVYELQGRRHWLHVVGPETWY